MKANLQLLKKVGQIFNFLTFFVNPDEFMFFKPGRYRPLRDTNTIRREALCNH